MASVQGEKHNVLLSKALSRLLRHGLVQEGLKPTPEGYVPVDKVLRLPRFANYKLADVQEVVKLNDKQRFKMIQDDRGEWLIRANQGHSIQGISPDLKAITEPAEYPVVVHGTFYKSWPLIKESGGLSKMRRTHIHFAKGITPGKDGVISGMRQACNVLIYIDLEKALRDGFEFFESENGVVLCAGNADGYLPTQYFKRVVQRRKGKEFNLLNNEEKEAEAEKTSETKIETKKSKTKSKKESTD